MKHSILLILTAILSACSLDMQNKTDFSSQTVTDGSPVSYMTEQEKELHSVLTGTSFKLKRDNNTLVVFLSGKDLFLQGSSKFSETLEKTLQKIAPVLNRYDKTRISIAGYVNHGSPFADRAIAEKQAQEISNILKQHASIEPARFWVEGFNPETPIQTNEDYITSNHIKITLTPTFLQ